MTYKVGALCVHLSVDMVSTTFFPKFIYTMKYMCLVNWESTHLSMAMIWLWYTS